MKLHRRFFNSFYHFDNKTRGLIGLLPDGISRNLAETQYLGIISKRAKTVRFIRSSLLSDILIRASQGFYDINGDIQGVVAACTAACTPLAARSFYF